VGPGRTLRKLNPDSAGRSAGSFVLHHHRDVCLLCLFPRPRRCVLGQRYNNEMAISSRHVHLMNAAQRDGDSGFKITSVVLINADGTTSLPGFKNLLGPRIPQIIRCLCHVRLYSWLRRSHCLRWPTQPHAPSPRLYLLKRLRFPPFLHARLTLRPLSPVL